MLKGFLGQGLTTGGAMVDDLTGRVQAELSDIIESTNLALPSLDAPTITRIIGQGCSDEVEGLLEIRFDGENPRVIRYELKSIIIGAVTLIGGLQAGFLGAVLALAGLWELWGLREHLSPSACLIVWLLAQSEGSTLNYNDLEHQFQTAYTELFDRAPISTEFASIVVGLEEREILSRQGSVVVLSELFFVRVAEA